MRRIESARRQVDGIDAEASRETVDQLKNKLGSAADRAGDRRPIRTRLSWLPE